MAKTVTIVTPGSKAHYSASNIDTNFASLNTNFVSFLHLGGTTESSNSMTGNLDMGAKKVTNAGTPSLAGDLATKGYVDALSGLASTGTLTDTVVQDADLDTGVQTEASSDLDRLDLFAAVTGGSDNAIQVVGDDASASALTNPYIDILKHVVLATGVRIGDAKAANTYLELNRSGSADHIYLVAGGNDVFELDSTSAIVSQHILMFDDGATAAGKRIGDNDGDTYIDFNTATGGTDDDIIRLVSRGSVVASFGPTTNTLAGAGVDVIFSDNLGVGISSFPADSEAKAIFMTTGTTVTTVSNLNDNEIVLYSVVNTGIQNDLKIDFKTGAASKATLILGKDSTFPNDVTIVNDLTVTNDLGVSGTLTPVALVLGGSAWPSFSAYMSGDQAISATTDTKLELDTEDFDTNSDYDKDTNYRFTPTVAGKYLLTASVQVTSFTDGERLSLRLYKNGSDYKTWGSVAGHITGHGIHGSIVVDANGSTDYFELYIDSTSDSDYVVERLISGSVSTHFSGSRIA